MLSAAICQIKSNTNPVPLFRWHFTIPQSSITQSNDVWESKSAMPWPLQLDSYNYAGTDKYLLRKQ